MIRAIVSVGPPAENGTTIATGRAGKFWADAALHKETATAKSRNLFMAPPPRTMVTAAFSAGEYKAGEHKTRRRLRRPHWQAHRRTRTHGGGRSLRKLHAGRRIRRGSRDGKRRYRREAACPDEREQGEHEEVSRGMAQPAGKQPARCAGACASSASASIPESPDPAG